MVAQMATENDERDGSAMNFEQADDFGGHLAPGCNGLQSSEHGRANYQPPGPSHLTKGVVRFELPATLRLRLKSQRCQKNINLPIETGPIILYQRHAPDALLVGGDNRRYRSRV